MVKSIFSILTVISLTLTATACGSAATPGLASTPTSVPPTPTRPAATSAPTPKPLPVHRIGVQVVDGVGEFFDRETGEKFIPRGNNYIRLAEQNAPGGKIYYHSTFNTGLYDPAEADEALRKMHSDGYNIVRVFLNPCCSENSLGDPTGGLSAAYVANLVDFLRLAKANGIFVLITTDDIPKVGGYIEIQDTTWSADFGGGHASYLRTGGVRANVQMWSDLIKALIQQEAPLDIIFAYELRNELFFDTNSPPLNMTSGTVQTANGKTYDMSSEADKQQMLDEGLVYWIDHTRARILELDPTALVTVGFFVPQGPNPARVGDTRLAVTAPAIQLSQADLIDLHPYPGFGMNLRQYVENFGMVGVQEKPIIIGEFGVTRSSFPSLASAANALMNWQVESCEYGFDGWLMWTWDLREDMIFYYALDGDGTIDQKLAPVNRPDPCQL